LQPQHQTWSAPWIRSLVQTLQHTSRIFPLPDGVGSLYASDNLGVQFTFLPPLSYRGHTDPADDPSIPYDQGFLLTNHRFIDPGPNRRLYDDDDLTAPPQIGPFSASTFPGPWMKTVMARSNRQKPTAFPVEATARR
jgi:hypothetical protein